MVKEVIIVEGKSDVAVVKRAIEADIITTGGFNLNKHTLEKIQIAYDKRGIIILTDPDYAGEQIRKRLTKKFPLAKQAFVAAKDATANNDIGIEQASPEIVQAALAKVRTYTYNIINEFAIGDLYNNDLTGTEKAAVRRNELGKILGIGYANSKQFLYRLNSYGVTRHEFEESLTKLKV